MSEFHQFNYKNHRGEIGLRTVIIDRIEWLPRPGYSYQPGWFLSGHDVDKNAMRSFALCNIVLPSHDHPTSYYLRTVITDAEIARLRARIAELEAEDRAMGAMLRHVAEGEG